MLSNQRNLREFVRNNIELFADRTYATQFMVNNDLEQHQPLRSERNRERSRSPLEAPNGGVPNAGRRRSSIHSGDVIPSDERSQFRPQARDGGVSNAGRRRSPMRSGDVISNGERRQFRPQARDGDVTASNVQLDQSSPRQNSSK